MIDYGFFSGPWTDLVTSLLLRSTLLYSDNLPVCPAYYKRPGRPSPMQENFELNMYKKNILSLVGDEKNILSLVGAEKNILSRVCVEKNILAQLKNHSPPLDIKWYVP